MIALVCVSVMAQAYQTPIQMETSVTQGRKEGTVPPRKAIPTELKRLRGNPGKRRMPAEGEEARPEKLTGEGFPSPPEWLGEYGVAEWWRAGPMLSDLGLLTHADLSAFLTYCVNWELLVQSVKQTDGGKRAIIDGARGEVRNPSLATMAQATTAIAKFAAEFGMTPSARARIRLPGDDNTGTLADLLAGVTPDDVA